MIVAHFRDESNSLSHHGVKGQKWGIRRYQNEDGTLTEEGKKKYGDLDGLSGKEISDTIKERQLGKTKTKVIAASVGAAHGYAHGTILKAFGTTQIAFLPTQVVTTGSEAVLGLLAGKVINKVRKSSYEKEQSKVLNKGAY